jgi:hypothetical protein
MSKLQESDVLMRIMAIASGIIVLIEAVLKIMTVEIAFWGWGWMGGAIALILAIFVILLGIKPIHYTPVFLGFLGVGIIVCGVLIGGIAVLIACIIGAMT